jgi:prepilin-type N-terminal cleavage/methylation domain-containing protein
MRSNTITRPTPPYRSGFSLVELLTVIAIISILMTVASVGLGNLTGGKGVATAVSTSEAVFEEARSLAVGKRTNAAVLVSVQDPSNPDTYLRRIVVAYKEIDPVTNVQDGSWTLASRGATLPDKVFYSTDLSMRDHKSGSGGLPTITLSTGKREYTGEYVIYEFNAEGICTTPGASFVVGTGTRTAGGNDRRPRVIGTAKMDFGGFVIFRNGNTAIFSDPRQITKGRTNINHF